MTNGLNQAIRLILLGALLALTAAPAAAKSVKECNQEYALRKGVVDAANEKKSAFIAECRTRGTGEPTPVATSGHRPEAD